MSKLYFKYGSMGSSKTAQALITKFNYEEKGMRVLLLKPATDTRDGVYTIKSRIGLSAEATTLGVDDSPRRVLDAQESKIDVIIVDECQFLSREQVIDLRDIVSYFDIPVLCFGLRTDFRAKLFPGSKALFELADSISEIKSVCGCGNKAIVNARFDCAGSVIIDGPQVDLGGNERYEAMCYKCWQERIANEAKK